MEFEISLRDLRFYAYHGVFEEEKKIGNEFRVSLSVFLPFKESLKEDLLDDTVSYAALYEIVKEEMEKPRNLLEKVAIEIAERIKKKFPEVRKGRVEVEKIHPPIPGILGTAAVALNF